MDRGAAMAALRALMKVHVFLAMAALRALMKVHVFLAMAALRALMKVHVFLAMAAAASPFCMAALQPQLKQDEWCAATAVGYVAVMRTRRLWLFLCADGQLAAFLIKVRRLYAGRTVAALAHGDSVLACFHLARAFAAVRGCPGHLSAHKAELIVRDVQILVALSLSFAVAVAVHKLVRAP